MMYITVTAYFPLEHVAELHPWSSDGYLLLRKCDSYHDGRAEYVSGFISAKDLALILFPGAYVQLQPPA